MDSYVIRIYRRDEKNPANFAGQVESVDSEETRPFGNAEELMEILAESGRRRRKGKIEPRLQEKKVDD